MSKYDDQTRFVHAAKDKRQWEKAAEAMAKQHGIDVTLSAWIRLTLNKAAEEQLKKEEE